MLLPFAHGILPTRVDWLARETPVPGDSGHVDYADARGTTPGDSHAWRVPHQEETAAVRAKLPCSVLVYVLASSGVCAEPYTRIAMASVIVAEALSK